MVSDLRPNSGVQFVLIDVPKQDFVNNATVQAGISNSASSISSLSERSSNSNKEGRSFGMSYFLKLPFYAIFYIAALPFKLLFAAFGYFLSFFQKSDKQKADEIIKAFDSPMNVEETKQKIKSFFALQRCEAEILAFFEMLLNKTPHLDALFEIILNYECSKDFYTKLLQVLLSKDKLSADQILLLLKKLDNNDEKNLQLFKTSVLKPVFCDNLEKFAKLLELSLLKLSGADQRILQDTMPEFITRKFKIEKIRFYSFDDKPPQDMFMVCYRSLPL